MNTYSSGARGGISVGVSRNYVLNIKLAVDEQRYIKVMGDDFLFTLYFFR